MAFPYKIFKEYGYVLLLMALIFAAFSFALNNAQEGGDSALYLIGAKSLAEGTGYFDISPPEPAAFVYPPLYSVILAPIVYIFGTNYFAAKLLSLIFTVLSIFPAYLIARRFFGGTISLLISATFALNLVVLWYSHRILSDAPFLFLSLIAMLLLLKLAKGQGYFYAVSAAVFICISYLARTAGLALCLAAGLSFMIGRNLRALAILAIVMSLPFLALSSYSNIAKEHGANVYTGQFFLEDVGDPLSRKLPVPEAAARSISTIPARAYFYFLISIPQVVFPPLDIMNWFFEGSMLIPLIGFFVFLIVAIGFAAQAKRGISPLHIYSLLYLAVLLFWISWDPSAVDRFILPIALFLIIFFAEGIRTAASRIRLPAGLTAEHAVLGVLLACILVSAGSDAYYLSTIQQRTFDAKYMDFIEANEWVADHASPSDIVWSNMPKRTFLLTGLHTVGPAARSGNELLETLSMHGVGYVLASSEYGGTHEQSIAAISNRLSLVHASENGKTRVYKFNNRLNLLVDPNE
ncbi:glycosyltransferase family 39 protein [Candidatus Micrarchaeota archaeon]|nr:glycosyltransferase family 39 protein [Candidatus Micrarchaeota archaeon]